jgi:hypothetical protein
MKVGPSHNLVPFQRADIVRGKAKLHQNLVGLFAKLRRTRCSTDRFMPPLLEAAASGKPREFGLTRRRRGLAPLKRPSLDCYQFLVKNWIEHSRAPTEVVRRGCRIESHILHHSRTHRDVGTGKKWSGKDEGCLPHKWRYRNSTPRHS